MTETIKSEWRKARKRHVCNYCGEFIEPGEKYLYSLQKYDGYLYSWESHEKCEFIAQEIWSYCDPDEGMTEEDFMEGVEEICHSFVCPDCEKYDPDDWCEKRCCLDKVYECLKEYELYRAKREGCLYTWKLRKREPKDGEQE